MPSHWQVPRASETRPKRCGHFEDTAREPPSVHHRRTIGVPLRWRLSLAHAARASPRRVLVVRWQRGAVAPGRRRSVRAAASGSPCFWRTRLRCVHAARASPCRVRAFDGARDAHAARRHQAARPAACGAHPLLAHVPAICARAACVAAQGACGLRLNDVLLPGAYRFAVSGTPPLLAHAPVACARGARIAA